MQAAGNRGYGGGPVYVRTCGPRHSIRKATARLPTDDLDPRHNVLVTIVGNRSSHPPRASVSVCLVHGQLWMGWMVQIFVDGIG
jgi:hypothetical protein